MKDFKDHLVNTVRTPDHLFLNEFTNQYIFIREFGNFYTDYLIVYTKITDNEGFVITSHPVSRKRINRKMKKWKKLNL